MLSKCIVTKNKRGNDDLCLTFDLLNQSAVNSEEIKWKCLYYTGGVWLGLVKGNLFVFEVINIFRGPKKYYYQNSCVGIVGLIPPAGGRTTSNVKFSFVS